MYQYIYNSRCYQRCISILYNSRRYQRCISIFIIVVGTRDVCIIVDVTRDVSVYL